MTCARRKRSRRPGTRTTAGTALRRSGASSQLKPPERSTVGRDSHSVCEWLVLNGYCIASWVKWRDFVSRARRALRAGPSVTFYRSEARNISVIGIFRQQCGDTISWSPRDQRVRLPCDEKNMNIRETEPDCEPFSAFSPESAYDCPICMVLSLRSNLVYRRGS